MNTDSSSHGGEQWRFADARDEEYRKTAWEIISLRACNGFGMKIVVRRVMRREDEGGDLCG